MDTSPEQPTITAAQAARRAAVTIRRAAREDLPEVLRVQREGFTRVARDAGVEDSDLPPLVETLDDLDGLLDAGVRTYVAVDGTGAGERIVGTVRATLRDDGDVEIGRMAVDGTATRRGVARALMLALEEDNPLAHKFVLFTGGESHAALALYAGLGYRVFRTQRMDTWTLVWLSKERPATVAADAQTAPAADAGTATAAGDAPLH